MFSSRKTPVRGILKSRAVTPELVHENSSLAVKSKEVADKALNIINPYRWPPKHNIHYQWFPRKYIKRQKNLQKALSWWEDEEQNPEIGYLDFSKRKILFNFGSFRRGSEASINIRWMNLEILDRNCSKLIVTRSLSDHESTKGLPGHFLRKWKRAGAVLNAANLLRSSLQKKRYFTDS